MASEHFSLCWDNFHKNMSTGMQSLLETEDLVDVTLAVEGRYLKAHKMLLSVCSPYFRQLFQSNPCQHPIVFMKDVSYVALSDLLHFMYLGEVQVAQENLPTFIKTAEALQIKGLTRESRVQNEIQTDQEVEKPVEETTEKCTYDSNKQKSGDSSEAKRFFGPASKRPQYCNFTATSTPVSTLTAPTENKYEFASVNTYNVESCDDVNLKLEPSETIEPTQIDTVDEHYSDETNPFKMDDEIEDFSLMESENDDPKPGTSTEDGDNQEAAQTHSITLLHEKSRKQYDGAYKIFMDWRTDKNHVSFSESVLLEYFEELCKKYKSSSLWTQYSMLRSTLNIYHSVNIENYLKLRALLRRKSKGYRPKKAKTFTPDEINTFIKEAPDNIYLATKVAFIMGLTGGCRSIELHAMNVEDFQDLGSAALVTVRTNRTKFSRQFTITGHFYTIYKKYADLRPSHTTISSFFLNFQNGKCTVQRIGINKFGAMGKQVAKFLKLPNPELYTGHSFRKSSATVLVAGGNIIALKRHGRWKSISATEG